MSSTTFEETIFEQLAEDTEKQGDLPEEVAEAEASNFVTHAASLSMTKLSDGLIDPKLVLSWLLTHLGAPAAFVGLLVPIREAGALLPQLFTAARIHAMKQRKYAWAAGSAGQGLSVAVILIAALTLEGAAAGAVICAALAVLAISRSVCSVSYKDVLGKTVAKSRRGTATGTASSVASVGVVVFALILIWGVAERFAIVTAALGLAAILWGAAALMFLRLTEADSAGESDGGIGLGQLSLLREKPQLLRFIVVRGLLTSTALAPPFLVLMASGNENGFQQLGWLVLASSAASLSSSYIWGRVADKSSRRVMQMAGVLGAAALGLALLFNATGEIGSAAALATALFVLMIAYHGVRQGRSTYLVDMAPEDQRAAYTAVSNTVIGLILIASGVFGLLAGWIGAWATVALFALMSLAAAVVAQGLDEVEEGLT